MTAAFVFGIRSEVEIGSPAEGDELARKHSIVISRLII